MARGGAAKIRSEPERRCIATGVSGPTSRLIRFVLDPGGEVVPDLAARLPGRGVWLTADRALVQRAVEKKLFSRGFRAQVGVPADLADRLEALLAKRLIELIGLARKAGQAVSGFEKVRAKLAEGAVGVVLQARDGAADGKAKLARLARSGIHSVPVIDVLDSAELGLAFGRDFAIHAALDRGGFADRAIGEAARLEGLRTPGMDVARRTIRADGAPASGEGLAGPVAASGQGDR
jgi:predicted RNA-binding protein YlxR (DUF448 family)